MNKNEHTVTIPLRDYEQFNKQIEKLLTLQRRIYNCFDIGNNNISLFLKDLITIAKEQYKNMPMEVKNLTNFSEGFNE